jgi:hypothetical protein
MGMKFAGFDSIRWSCLVASAAMTAAAPAFAGADAVTTDDNPYTVISQRNVFRLSPPPPPAAPEADKPADLPKVMLTGFFESAHVMRVLLAIPPLKGATNSIAYLSLKAGERKDDVEVVRIRYEKGEVDIINSGTAMTLSAASNTFAASGMALKGAGEGRSDSRKEGQSGIHRFGAKPSADGGTAPPAPLAALPVGSPAAPGAPGSSAVIMGGGAGYEAGATPGAGSTSSGYPGAGLANSGAGTSGSGNVPSRMGAFVSGSGGGSPTLPNHAGGPSMSEAQMMKYLADQAAQNQAATPLPPAPDQ